MLLPQDILDMPRMLFRALAFYSRSQFWNTAQIHTYQDRMLRRLIQQANDHVPYYRRLFADIGLQVNKFRGRVDMHKIPLLDKETLRLHTSEFIAANADQLGARWYQTSGSTGTPLSYILDTRSRYNDGAVTLRSYAWAGLYPGMKLFSVKDYLKQFTYKYSLGGRALSFDLNSLNLESAKLLWPKINALKPKVFRSYPFTLMMLYHYGQQAGIPMHRPQKIITTGESLPQALRKKLETSYQAEVFDYYGMTENSSLITECMAHTYHVIEDYAFHEFLGPGLQPVRSGRAEIVATNLYNYAMPLIRYRTRDLAWLSPHTQTCPCGLAFRSVEKIEGRKEDYILTPDGTRLNLIETPLNAGQGITMAQYVQDAWDHMYVNIVPGPDFEPDSLQEVKKELRRLVGDRIGIDFHLVDRLEQRGKDGLGKIPFIYSKIGKSLYE
ncbi:MAG: hypothetical protein U5L00_13720 [Desulfovermiculus sp.]|nr:hypothetical protein [Desulfovermiculus sp.]